ncbi:MAG TPA: hypothetical protein VHG91_18400 [Longimicrobium sp.]|nr:hypothetical protein [Longimicrobium sp.]
MGFKDVRTLLIDALESGRYQHEYRKDMESKNLLAVGEVGPEFVVSLLRRCGGAQYRASSHHFDAGVLCHQFTPRVDGEGWYVKAYFLACDAVFISVHRS